MIDRRRFLQLAAAGGSAVFASALPCSLRAAGYEEFFFVQLSDSHWGYSGPANPEADSTLRKAVASVNALEIQPDFIVFTGDLTHTTDDSAERRRRMTEFRGIVSGLKVRDVRFVPGEHDASLDSGAAFKELFGETHYSFDHKGVHFVAIDSAKSLIFALPAPLSQPKRAPLPWDPAQPNKGLGFREVEAEVNDARYKIAEFPVAKG